jgi:hypothetical protein
MLRSCRGLSILGLTTLVVTVTAAQTPVTRTAVASATQAPVTFAKDVLPILQKNCQSCHRAGQIGPMSLLTYSEARPWARAIKTQVVGRNMPPWHADPRFGHFVNDRSLTQQDIDTLAAWADGGAVEGDPKDAPPAIQWPSEGWLVQPDLVVTLPAYEVPASGTIEWENLAVPSPFSKDTWITSIEILPSAAASVHHMCFEFQKHRPEVAYNRYEWAEVPRDEQGAPIRQPAPVVVAQGQAAAAAPAGPPSRDAWILTRDAGSAAVTRRFGRPTLTAGGSHCYVPGMSLHDYRSFDAGQLVAAGADMVFNLHYQTTGKPITNTVKVGFTLAKATPRKKFVQITPSGATAAFAIPPNESNYLAPMVNVEIKKDAELVWMSPHMHFRGKDMTWSLVYPDGKRETVLSVPRYQYNWQLQYHTRVRVPAGTKMTVVAHYDNSPGNRFNPNPNSWVYPGTQAWEEMMVPFTWFIVDTEVDERELTGRFTRADGA